MKLYTIGFAGKTAREFFTILRNAGVKKVIDVRLYPSTKDSGFAKAKDVEFFLSVLCHIKYEHHKEYAPTAKLLKEYKAGSVSWAEYEKQYDSICHARHFTLTPDMDGACFLCAEPTPDHCHRRLLAEYLSKQGDDVQIVHL